MQTEDILFDIETDGLGTWIRDKFTGKRFPYVSGAADDDGDDDADDDDDGDDDDGDDEDDDAKRHQAELARVGTKERKKGERAARRKLLEELGVKSVDDAKAIIGKGKPPKPDDADTNDADSGKLAEREREIEGRELKAVRKANMADIVAEVASQGLTKDDAKRVARMVDVDLDDDELDEDDITEAVKDLRKKMPKIFETEGKDDDDKDERPARRPKDSTPRGRGPKPPRANTAESRARARLDELHPSTSDTRQSA